jgi:hypothetical protein
MSQEALDLLLSGVKDAGQRKQITSAYYASAHGDPETFAVQFAVLLRAHAASLKLLPARLEKALSAETRKLGDLVIAHQNSVQRMAALLDEEARTGWVGRGRIAVPRSNTRLKSNSPPMPKSSDAKEKRLSPPLPRTAGFCKDWRVSGSS